jgi:hypothetical protein
VRPHRPFMWRSTKAGARPQIAGMRVDMRQRRPQRLYIGRWSRRTNYAKML